ncbi:YbaB/EbfC family nucleoid-associated protein [Candidatus Liberibacter sp.]|uniref:YbaB/EbfC family nucleoid-associated protein n=1 Tax=Candidatus Liberibacter sp. TaxID=34022 RepID=UPI0015F4FD05|nr:YbaB/EbfC family nucleoid-associated protein [Candidatus Liberibacter sp.]MBA5724441.1 YbaB/EbfC family nucleoid-associated protein [Candidatus Liberibacter sp.]
MSNMMKMMGQVKEIQEKMGKMQDVIANLEAEGVSGGGLVRVRLNGKNTLIGLKIDDSLLCKEDSEILEDLVVAAHRDARQNLEEMIEAKTREITSGLSLPPGFKFPI